MSAPARYRSLVQWQMTPDTPEAIAWRLRDNEARRLAHADMVDLYPTLTPENAGQAIGYLEARIAHHHAALGGSR